MLRQKSCFTMVLLIILSSMVLLTLINASLPKNNTPLINNLANLPINSRNPELGPSLMWNITWGGSSKDYGFDVAVDTAGAIYCVGRTPDPIYSDLALVKFYSNGTEAWNTTWGGSKNDYGFGVAIDTTGAIYCGGGTYSYGAGYSDLALIKFYANGTKVWNTTWGGSGLDEARGVAVDATGAIYCVGSTSSFGAGEFDFVLLKFYANGTKIWNTTWGGLIEESAYGLALDTSGAIYCVGFTRSFGEPGSTDNLALVKFYPNGTKAWNTTWGGLGVDHGYGVAVDATGTIYCVGSTYSFGAGESDLALVKFHPNSTMVWNSTWGGSGYDLGYDLALGISGSIYCVGHTNLSDFLLIGFYANGEKAWNTTWGGSGGGGDRGVAVDATGAIYCVGSTTKFGAGSVDLILIKFSQPPVSLDTPILERITPNPDSDGLIELNWNDVAGATKYYVYRDISNITSVTGLIPVASVSQSAYQDKIITNQTYFYVIVAGNSGGNSSISNCESVVIEIIDVAPPNYFNEKLSLSSPQYYAPSQLYQFNITIIDNLIVDYVVFQWGSNNYTVSTHVENEYYYQLLNLGVGTYEYRWFFRDSLNNWNASTLKFYIIDPNPSGLDILLNGTSNNYQINWGQYCNITLTLPIREPLYLYLNGAIVNIESAPLINITRFNQIGIYNITAYYAGNQNYTAMVLTRWLTVRDIEPPQLIHFPNLTYLNCTLLEYYHSGLRIALNVSDNVLVGSVILCENSTGSFVNRSIINSIGNIYWIALSIEELQYGDNLAYYFYAKDTSNNWGMNGNLTNIYLLKIHDFVNPSGYTISCPILYLPNFILEENTIFTISGGDDFGGSGIDHFKFKWDSGPWLNGSIVSCVGIPNGIHTLFYRAIDFAGNIGLSKNITIYLLANEADYDNDSLTNFAEILIYGTNALDPDTDGDGITDGDEILIGANPHDPANPLIGRILLIIEIIAAIILSAVIIRIAKISKKPLSSSKYPLTSSKNKASLNQKNKISYFFPQFLFS